MKLAFCKFNGLTLKEETFNMNRFNVAKVMRKLVATMGAMFIGMSIPAIVFKACEKSIQYSISGTLYGFNYVIPQVMDASGMMLTTIAKCVVMFLVIISIFKSIRNNDTKQFSKEAFAIIGGYILINLFKVIPIVIPKLMEYMRYL